MNQLILRRNWYDFEYRKNKTPIVDTWWQTETGGIMISSLAGVTNQKPTFATKPIPGIRPVLLNNQGHEINEKEAEGILAIKFLARYCKNNLWRSYKI